MSQFLIAGFHCGLCLQQTLFAFLAAPSAEAYSLEQTEPTHVAQHGLYLINVGSFTLAGDNAKLIVFISLEYHRRQRSGISSFFTSVRLSY